jgi:hypothetical protein
MKRIFYGMAGIVCGVASLHFLTGWMQVNTSTGCYGSNSCMHAVQRGGDQRSDKQNTILLFAAAAFCIWQAGSTDHSGT